MTKKSVFRFAGLFLTLAVLFTTCGWLPFVAPVTINSTPEGAEVYSTDSEEPLGVTPYKTSIFHPKKEFEVRLDKYHTESVVLNYDSPKEVFVTLTPKPVLVYSKPTAEIFEAGSDTPMGKTPLEVEVVEEDRDYVLKLKDYYEQDVTVGLSADNPIIVELAHRPLITISAAQSGVDIYENGSFLSKAPLSTEVEQSRTFEFRKDGYYKKTVSLTPAQTHELGYATSVELTPLPVIEIDVTPASAEVFIVGNDKPISTGSTKIQIEKETSFEVKADRYYSETFTVQAKDQLATVKLDPMPYVTISSYPSGASVSIDGKIVGTTPTEQLIEDTVSVTLTKEGYLPKTGTLDGSDLRPSFTLEEVPPPPPTVTISSTPAGATVTIDGTAVGVTPVEQAIAKPVSAVLSLEGYLSQTNTLDGSDLNPMITLVEVPAASGLSMGLIAGIGIATIAAIGIIIAVIKKGKKK